MNEMTPPPSDSRPRFGFTDEELATLPTVYRDDLLKGQVMLISGGGSGIGKGITFLAARLGAEVVICGRTPERLDATADAVERATGLRPPLPARLADLYDREERFSVLADDLGAVEAAVRAHARRNAA